VSEWWLVIGSPLVMQNREWKGRKESEEFCRIVKMGKYISQEIYRSPEIGG
jgi:hypothetical protein